VVALGQRQTQDLRGEPTRLGQFLGRRAVRRDLFARGLFHGQLIDEPDDFVRLPGANARYAQQVLALEVDDVQERSVSRRLQRRERGHREVELPQREVSDLVLLLATAEERRVCTTLE